MVHYRTALVAALAALAAAAALTSSAQQLNAGQCIVAGRVTDQQKWAPKFDGLQLMAARGRIVTSADRTALADVQQVRIMKPALLTKCDGDGDLMRADEQPVVPKEPVPAVGPGVVDVEGVSFPKLRRGGELVELRLKLPLERVVMVKR